VLFTQEEQEAYGTMNSKPDRETTVKDPTKFKGSVKWKPWKEAVMSWLKSVLNKDFIPLHKLSGNKRIWIPKLIMTMSSNI
jgi:hypothetical protein